MTEVIQYIREDRKPVGVMVAFRDDDGSVHIGWSKCNKKDTFDKQLGLKIAVGRAEVGSSSPIPRCVQDQFNEFKKRMSRYFKTPVE